MICIENNIIDQLQISGEKLIRDLALGLYADNQLTLLQASALAEMESDVFLKFASSCGIAVHYDMDDLNHDLKMLRERGIA